MKFEFNIFQLISINSYLNSFSKVYQLNVYDENLKFHSFRKVAYNMGSPYREMEIVSLNSASKGFSGE